MADASSVFLNVKLSQTRPLGHIAKMAITSPHLSRHTLSWEVEVPPIKRWSLFHRTWSLNVEIGLDLDEETGEFTADRDWPLRPCCLSLGLEP